MSPCFGVRCHLDQVMFYPEMSRVMIVLLYPFLARTGALRELTRRPQEYRRVADDVLLNYGPPTNCVRLPALAHAHSDKRAYTITRTRVRTQVYTYTEMLS